MTIVNDAGGMTVIWAPGRHRVGWTWPDDHTPGWRSPPWPPWPVPWRGGCRAGAAGKPGWPPGLPGRGPGTVPGSTGAAGRDGGGMSNHYSAAYLRFPGEDARLDFTAIYVFPWADGAAKTTLIMDVNPYTTGISAMPPFLMRAEFHPDGVYRINVDNNGDTQADAAFTFTFSEPRDGTQTCAAHYATGA